MSRTSKQYWKNREYYNLLKSKKRDEDFVNGRINDIYDSLLFNVERELRSNVVRFANSEGISIEQARRSISKADVNEFRRLAKEYVDNNDFSKKANRDMRLYNVTMRMNRLEFLNSVIRLHVLANGYSLESALMGHLINGSIAEYKRQASILGLSLSQTDIERKAKFIANQDYHNAHFSDRIWRDSRELQRRIERRIDTVIIQGKNPKDFARELRDLVSKDIKNIKASTERLAFTESGRIWIQTQIDAYKEGGYEYLEVMTEPTACNHCSPHDGDVVKISEAVEGDNIPLWHPRCRCTTVVAYGEVKDLEYWEHDGERYKVDGHHVILDYSEHEKNIADLLSIKLNKTVFMVPRVQFPLGVSTPDYLVGSEKWDLKTLRKEATNNTIFNRVQKAKNQADNFIVDISKTNLSKRLIESQIEKIFATKSTENVKEIIIVNGNNFRINKKRN